MRMVSVCLLSCLGLATSLPQAGQNAPTLNSPLAACGDEKITYEVTRGETGEPMVAPESGKAMIYIIEIFNLRDKGRFNRPTIRHGLNGAWLGATQGFTYLSTSVDSGQQHLCSRWQSRFGYLSQQVSLYNFDAVPGKTYFFRAQISVEGATGDTVSPVSIDLQPVSEDEGIFLLSQAARSLSKPK